MELRHLRYFVAVATEEHFGRAAISLGISAPPLSRQIQQLSDEIGVRLFETAGRGVRLTEAGRVFFGRARIILAEVDQAAILAQAAVRGEFGKLSIRFAESTSYQQLVPLIINRFRVVHPGVELHLTPVSAIDIFDDVQEGKYQAAYCYQVPVHRKLKSEVLYRERVLLAVEEHHALAQSKSIRASQLREQPFILPPKSILPQELRTGLDKLAAKAGRLRVISEVVSSATRLNLVASGMGITLITESAKAILPRNVVIRPLADCHLDLHAVLVWREQDDHSPLLQSLRTVTRSLSQAFVSKFSERGAK